MFTLPAWVHRMVRSSNGRERVEAEPALVVGRHPHHPLATQAEHREGLEERHVDLLPHHHGERRGTEQALGLDVPALAGQEGVASRRERR